MRHFIYKHSFFLLMTAIVLSVVVNGQSDKPRQTGLIVYSNNDSVKATIDSPPTPKPKYWIHFSMRIDTAAYMRAIDTVLTGRSYIGRNLFYDEALFWQEATFRALQTLDSRIKKDTIKIQGR